MSRRWTMAAVGALAVFASWLTAAPAAAVETDQYWSWGRPMVDATAALNAKFALEIDDAFAAVNAREGSSEIGCEGVAREVRKRLHFLMFQDIELWTLHTPTVEKVPGSVDDELLFRQTNLYSRHGPFDTGTWIPNAPTVEVNGIRFGTDKLSHFVSSGWRYYQTYLEAIAKGTEPAAAEQAAMRKGILIERTVLGSMVSGIFSVADLEANYQGMRFFIDLCDGDDSLFQRRNGEWALARPLDIAVYITPEWDESYQASIYNEKRWRKVRPVLLEYCRHLEEPAVQEMRQRYRLRDRRTPTEEVVDELIAAGTLDDPADFTVEANCPNGRSFEAEGPEIEGPEIEGPGIEGPGIEGPGIEGPEIDPPATAPAPASKPDPELVATLRQLDEDRRRRWFGLTGIQLTYPKTFAISLGWLVAKLPAATECHTVCAVRGPFAQIEPGVHGGQVSVGYAKIIGEKKRNEHFFSDIYLAFGIKAAWLRTWGSAEFDPESQSLIGLEGEFTITRVNFSLGLFHSLAAENQSDDWVVTGGLGWGF